MALDVNHLVGKRWVHSHEDDTSDTKVFRPEVYKFPPSRGRFSFELKASGRSGIHGIGATDRAQPTEGTWSVENDDLILSSADEEIPKLVFRVLSVSPDRLVVKK